MQPCVPHVSIKRYVMNGKSILDFYEKDSNMFRRKRYFRQHLFFNSLCVFNNRKDHPARFFVQKPLIAPPPIARTATCLPVDPFDAIAALLVLVTRRATWLRYVFIVGESVDC